MSALIGVLFIFVVFPVIYFVPAMVAHKKHHPNATAIFVLDLFLGWTFIGWVLALVWACTNNHAPSQSNQ
jgi:hypothetical protein